MNQGPRPQRLRRLPASAVLFALAAVGAPGCNTYECGTTEGPSPSRDQAEAAPDGCSPDLAFVLRLAERLPGDAEPPPDLSGLSVRLCVDGRCEDRPLLSGAPLSRGGGPAFAFAAPVGGDDLGPGQHLAALSIYTPGGRAPLFTDAREFDLAGAPRCDGPGCPSACVRSTIAFDVPTLAPPADAPLAPPADAP